MIKFDYTIIRDEGDERVTYVPNLIPKELSDVVCIEAPNSSGKSTLLNLIALGFFGRFLEKNELNPALKEKIEYLLDSNHQEITFEIETHNNMLLTSLKACKRNAKSDDITVYKVEGNKEIPISYDSFKKEYKLIYDIPSDPLRRIPELLNEVENSQHQIGNKVSRIGAFVTQAISDIKHGKNPQHITSLKEELKINEIKIEKIRNSLKDNESLVSNLKKFFASKFYLSYKTKYDDANKRLEEVKKDVKKSLTTERKQSQGEYNLKSTISDNTHRLIRLHSEILSQLKYLLPIAEEHRLLLWRESDCRIEISKPDVIKTLRGESLAIRNILETEKLKDEKGVLGQAKFLKSLRNLLVEFKSANIQVPETGKSTEEFLEILNEMVSNSESILNKNENIVKTVELLEGFHDLMEIVIKDSHDFLKISQEHGKTVENTYQLKTDTRKDDLEKKANYYKTQLDSYDRELSKLDIDASLAFEMYVILKKKEEILLFDQYSEDQMRESLTNKEALLIRERKSFENLKKVNEVLNIEIIDSEKKKPHKYLEYLVELERIQEIVQTIDQKMSKTFAAHIDKIKRKNVKLEDLNVEEVKYLNAISTFLGMKVSSIKHGTENFKVKSIDVIKKEIITDNGKKIHFSDMGTGQSQGAYLSGLLSMNEDKKIIALFDEVAMMDEETLKPIFSKLQELYRQKKLVLGVIVQKSNQLKISSLV
jgi:DNA repair protein SbcC/Rad50